MATGTIASLRDRGFGDRGFGFVAADAGRADETLFFHRSAVAGDGVDRLRAGQRVRFDREPDPRDPTRQRAVRVTPLADGDPA